ncbi:MAG: lysostaphin resistance A-like protein [Verrucomicrobiota bacterium]
MRELRLLSLYLGFVFVGGALLAPWAWKSMQALAGAWPRLEGLAQQPFHRYVNRCLLALALVGLWPLLRSLGLHGKTRHGWHGPWCRPILLGTAGGLASCLIVVLAPMLVEDASVAVGLPPGWMARRAASALATAAGVAVLEEWLFRGLIHGALRRSLSFPQVASITSLLYAVVHFFDRPPQPEVVGVFTGLWTLGRMTHGLWEASSLMPGLLNLFAVGWMLALARERTGSLALSMGVHGGWVLGIKLLGPLVIKGTGTSAALWGTSKVFDGWASSAVLAVQLLAIHSATRTPSIPAQQGHRT